MSIASEINRIKDAKTALIAVIRSKGVEVPDGVSIEQLETYAAQIQQGTDAEKAAALIVGASSDDGVVYPSISANEDDLHISAFNTEQDVQAFGLDGNFEPIEGSFAVDEDTITGLEFDFPQNIVADAIGLEPGQIVSGNTVLGVEGTAESATYEGSTLESDIDAWGEAYASKMAQGVQSYDADGNIVRGAAINVGYGETSTASSISTIQETDTGIRVLSRINGVYNGNFSAPLLMQPGALLEQTMWDKIDLADAIGLEASKIVKGNTILDLIGTGGITPETPSITVSTGGLITASANGLSKTQQLTTQAAKTVTPTKSSQTAVASGRYTTGAVTVAAIPSQYIVPSGSQTLTENKEYDVTSLASVTVNVPTSGGGGMNVQGYCGAASVSATSYTATAVQLTVAKTGTYKVSWCGGRNTNSGTSGSQLYINNSAYGTAQTSFSNTYFQSVTLNNVSLTAGQTIVVRARARSTSYVMWVGNLIIEQTA